MEKYNLALNESDVQKSTYFTKRGFALQTISLKIILKYYFHHAFKLGNSAYKYFH